MATVEKIAEHLNIIGRPDLIDNDNARHQAEVYINLKQCQQVGSLTCYPCVELGVQVCDGTPVSKLQTTKADI